ncbi:hypothetical protein SADUNF_Sadunf14G0062400 [Salix dunnii]|uniref:Erythronate-4-phosphate dehydrogenase family protein n=1 Tax=Salix dunnii TaxID=1413687 RepID=A0A835MM47_9ROSI|nr:hypothetical protein SADUNF_Sadunf14G0062400 [Salix dunnii]
MDQNHIESNSYKYLITNKPSSWLEIRLFYVRITPCVIESVPDHLTIRHLRRSISTPLEINGSKIPSSDPASLTLRRDRINKETLEVTYVSTDSVRVTRGVEFEVLDNKDMVLCGSLERIETTSWGNNGSVGGLENDAKTGWSLECCVAAGVFEGNSVFKIGVSAPVIEVYIAGCCGGVPVILTKTILVSPRKKPSRYAMLDAIPEDEELDNRNPNGVISDGLVRQRKVQVNYCECNVDFDVDRVVMSCSFAICSRTRAIESLNQQFMIFQLSHQQWALVQITEAEDDDDYESDEKIGNRYYSEDMYYGEDGQLSWFNAGVRVGVGIGLGMCLGAGIGVGLLMRSYQTTTRNFRRRFL